MDIFRVYRYLKGGCEGKGKRLFPVAPSDRTRGTGHKLKHGGEFPPQHQEILVCCESHQELAQVSQKAAVLCILGDIQSCLEVVLYNMLYMNMFLEHEQLTKRPLQVPSNLHCSVTSWAFPPAMGAFYSFEDPCQSYVKMPCWH